ncbi:hypothetical protein BGZ89_002871 [Linnemannia elongata]|nr:hypothetical protein BGZ89_002871 [Linnemannia elongata]
MSEVYEEEYYDDEEGEDYNEEQEEDAEYQYNEEGGDEDGDIQVGEEIDLTHEEVWDDSALIEAWDMAVKQYEVYHSKANPKETSKDKVSKSSTLHSSNKHKNIDSVQQSTTSPTKRTKLIHNNGTATTSHTTRSEPDSSPTPTSAQSQQPPSQVSGSQYDVSERKPSFKKADKPSFSHHKERREEFEKEKTRKAKASATTTTAVPSSSTSASAAPVPTVDAATIAYYQQLGYYYDPSYATTQNIEQGQEGDEKEDQSQEQEQLDHHQHQQEQGHNGSRNEVEAAGNGKVSGSAHALHGSGASSSKTKPISTSTSASSRAALKNRAAYPVPNPYGHGPTMHPSQLPLYPSPHGSYPGYYPGHLPPVHPSHIPPGAPTAAAAAAGPRGGFGFPAPPGLVPPGWNGPGGPTPFGHGSFAAGGQGMMPPPPPLPPFPSHSGSGGPFSGPKMDDEALGNLIMAWYFSGYYTGLYQAQRR